MITKTIEIANKVKLNYIKTEKKFTTVISDGSVQKFI